MLDKNMKDCLPREGSHTGEKEQYEEDEEAETTCNELTTTPIPLPLYHSGGGSGEVRSEDEPRKKGKMEGRCFQGFFLYLLILL